jgi:hypothetical protein
MKISVAAVTDGPTDGLLESRIVYTDPATGSVIRTIELLKEYEFPVVPRIGEWIVFRLREKRTRPTFFRRTRKVLRGAVVTGVFHHPNGRPSIDVKWLGESEPGSAAVKDCHRTIEG